MALNWAIILGGIMTIIVEDGTGLLDAESLVSVIEARGIAAKWGYTLPAADAELEVLLRKAFTYMDKYESALSGYRTVSTQSGIFPRTDCITRAWAEVDAHTVPVPIKRAQVRLAVEYSSQELDSTFSYGGVSSVTLTGVLSVSMNTDSKAGSVVVVREAVDLIRQYCYSVGGVIHA